MRINGVDLNDFNSFADRRTAKAARLILSALEIELEKRDYKQSREVFTILRKVVLDELNDLRRDIVRNLIK